ncbi:MAG TPA: hypothetical protein VIZ64_04035 [Dokdonella sp.]|jgi:hypothetical protein
MRYLLCLLLGALVGALLASTAASALQRRNEVPRALMTLMKHDFAAARNGARASDCSVPSLAAARTRLDRSAADIEHRVLAPAAKDRVFAQYAADLRGAIARWDASSACALQVQALTDIGHACDACHRDYR